MEHFGATVNRIDGNYDASVTQAQTDADANGWFIVSDTSYEGYLDLPRYVAAGYSVFMDEAMQQISDHDESRHPLTHVFVQGGVGGLASAVCGFLWQRWGRFRPRFVIVEPVLADCLYQSAVNGHPTAVDIQEETLMAGLSCGEVSVLGWKILEPVVEDCLTVDDELVGPTMKLLADGASGAGNIVAGESAVAGLAGLMGAAVRDEFRTALGLDANATVLVIGTEGATDPDIYRELVGRSAEEVAA